VLENAVRFLFGNDLRGYDLPLARDLRFAGLRIGPQQLNSLALAAVIMAAVFAFLRYTRFGKAMRAVADNPDLARLKGIDPARIAAIAVFLGAGLSGAGGVLIGLDTSIDPLTGYRVLLSVFAAAEELAMLVFPATYRAAVGFVAILLMLTFRPRGLLGERAA
jgi:branched-subunit amino acid ABC-type transport system permease component